MPSDPIISFCGDNCSECPRYVATVNNDINALKEFAELWFRLGFRPKVVNPEEIKCHGCSKTIYCSNDINNCENLSNKMNCGECDLFPCDKIETVFQKTDRTESVCKEKCSDSEYEILKKAFFSKRQILDEINNKYRKSSK